METIDNRRNIYVLPGHLFGESFQSMMNGDIECGNLGQLGAAAAHNNKRQV
jgi:hypothetical protein